MKRLSIMLCFILMISIAASGMLWAFASPSSEMTRTKNSDSAATSQNTVTEVSSGDTTASNNSGSGTSDIQSDASPGEEESSGGSEDSSFSSETFSSDENSSKTSGTASSVSSHQQNSSSSAASKTSSSHNDDSYINDTDDDDDYVQVTSDTLSQPVDADGDGIDDAKEEKMDLSVGRKIARIIWIPILLAVASAAGLITINVMYRKKYSRLIRKKERKSKLSIPRD